MASKIHVITTINDVKWPRGSRTVGFYHDLNHAIESVEYNDGDIYENGWFRYCVIESIDEGMYSIDTNGLWFEWKEHKGYRVIDIPEKFKGVAGFGMG